MHRTLGGVSKTAIQSGRWEDTVRLGPLHGTMQQFIWYPLLLVWSVGRVKLTRTTLATSCPSRLRSRIADPDSYGIVTSSNTIGWEPVSNGLIDVCPIPCHLPHSCCQLLQLPQYILNLMPHSLAFSLPLHSLQTPPHNPRIPLPHHHCHPLHHPQ